MVLDLLRRLFGKRDVDDYKDLRGGRVVARGTIRAGADLVRSPLKGLTCVAYYYRAFYKAQARGKWVDRVIKEAEVYSPSFALEMQGGTLPVVPPSAASFDPSEHRALQAKGFRGFQATEQVVRPGTRVKLHGRLGKGADGLFLRLKQIDLVTEEVQEGGPYRRPERRRRRKR